ncbi:MAG TPA: site-2 protease family protein, partial [Planctomycetota bacterium]|nr:site-2 protease family protein [Planctomycetota bacterium]
MQFVYPSPPQPILLRVQGIPVRIHRWLLALMIFISLMAGRQPQGYSFEAVVGTALALLVLFLAVLMHEIGHALVARRMGVEVVDITLWPLGGMAVLRNMPEDPQIEMRIALAGPLVNLAIGGTCLLIWVGLQGELRWASLLHTEVRNLGGFLSFSAVCHLMLGIFNLLPAFPMDGGKMLRSGLAHSRSWLAATETAVRVGRWIAWILLALGIAQRELALVLIAVYLLVAGTKELWSTRLRHLSEAAGGFAGPLAGFDRPGDAEVSDDDSPIPTYGSPSGG